MILRDDLMVQQQLKHPDRKWKHMIAVMCLNQTYRKQVKRVLPELWDRYPTPKKYLSGRLSKQQKILEPLGMWRVRSNRIRKMTEQYLTWDGKDPADLHGIGKYGSDSYKIFFLNTIPDDVTDKELKKYIEEIK